MFKVLEALKHFFKFFTKTSLQVKLDPFLVFRAFKGPEHSLDLKKFLLFIFLKTIALLIGINFKFFVVYQFGEQIIKYMIERQHSCCVYNYKVNCIQKFLYLN
jgi:hypothetical protein